MCESMLPFPSIQHGIDDIRNTRTFASSAPSTAAFRVAAEFHSSTEVSYLVTSVFLVGYVFGTSGYPPSSVVVFKIVS